MEKKYRELYLELLLSAFVNYESKEKPKNNFVRVDLLDTLCYNTIIECCN